MQKRFAFLGLLALGCGAEGTGKPTQVEPSTPSAVEDAAFPMPGDVRDGGADIESAALPDASPPAPSACVSRAEVSGCATGAASLEPICVDLRPGDPCASAVDTQWLSGCFQTTSTSRHRRAGTCAEWRAEQGKACKSDVSNVQAPAAVPPAPHRNACTSKQIADFRMLCASAIASTTSCSNWVNVVANYSCYRCIVPVSGAGPIRILPTGDEIFNVGGCIAATTTDPASRACGQKLDAVAHCANEACAACEAAVARTACLEAAVANECQQKFDPTLCKAALPPAASECLDEGKIISKFCE